MSRGAKSHQSHEAGSNADQRTGRNDDERQLPPFDKSDAEPAHKGGEALHEYGHLVGNGVVDLVDVTGGKKNVFDKLKFERGTYLTTIPVQVRPPLPLPSTSSPANLTKIIKVQC